MIAPREIDHNSCTLAPPSHFGTHDRSRNSHVAQVRSSSGHHADTIRKLWLWNAAQGRAAGIIQRDAGYVKARANVSAPDLTLRNASRRAGAAAPATRLSWPSSQATRPALPYTDVLSGEPAAPLTAMAVATSSNRPIQIPNPRSEPASLVASPIRPRSGGPDGKSHDIGPGAATLSFRSVLLLRAAPSARPGDRGLGGQAAYRPGAVRLAFRCVCGVEPCPSSPLRPNQNRSRRAAQTWSRHLLAAISASRIKAATSCRMAATGSPASSPSCGRHASAPRCCVSSPAFAATALHALGLRATASRAHRCSAHSCAAMTAGACSTPSWPARGLAGGAICTRIASSRARTGAAASRSSNSSSSHSIEFSFAAEASVRFVARPTCAAFQASLGAQRAALSIGRGSAASGFEARAA